MYGYLDFDRIRGGLGNVRGYCLSELNLKRGHLTMYRTVFHVPAYPASAELRVHSRGMMGTIDLDRHFPDGIDSDRTNGRLNR
jgi:hypothetical protein